MTTASWRCGSYQARRREESEDVDPCYRQRFHCKTSSAIRSSRGYWKEMMRSSCSIKLASRTSDSALMMVYMQEREVLAGLFFILHQSLPNVPKTSNLKTKNKIKADFIKVSCIKLSDAAHFLRSLTQLWLLRLIDEAINYRASDNKPNDGVASHRFTWIGSETGKKARSWYLNEFAGRTLALGSAKNLTSQTGNGSPPLPISATWRSSRNLEGVTVKWRPCPIEHVCHHLHSVESVYSGQTCNWAIIRFYISLHFGSSLKPRAKWILIPLSLPQSQEFILP